MTEKWRAGPRAWGYGLLSRAMVFAVCSFLLFRGSALASSEAPEGSADALENHILLEPRSSSWALAPAWSVYSRKGGRRG